MLSEVSFSYHVCGDADKFWLAQNARQSKKHQDLTMTLTCLQKIYSVLNHKARLERANGGKEMSSLTGLFAKGLGIVSLQ